MIPSHLESRNLFSGGTINLSAICASFKTVVTRFRLCHVLRSDKLPGMSMLSAGNHDRHNNFRRPRGMRRIVSEFGWRGVMALMVAALVAFLPLAGLIWFNLFRLSETVAVQISPQVIVAAGQFDEDQETQEPGETGLLQVKAIVPTQQGERELL